MHWLQALDIRLFDFITQSLANPFFDWLMPILSGNVLFFPAVVLIGTGMLWKGGRRVRLCVLMLLLIMPPGDAFVTNALKHTIARPRPFVTLPEARVFGTVGKGYVPPQVDSNGVDMSGKRGSRNSMPSSPAANWFSAPMIFLFYYP